MNQAPSLQETIAKGKKHYYDGLTFRKWRMTMLNMYGGDTRPYLEDAWNAITGEAESTAHTKRDKETTIKKSLGAPAKQPGPISFFGDATMLTLNAIACVALFGACMPVLPYSYYTRLRWICFAAFTYTAVWRRKDRAAVICLPLACLFNPFFPFHLSRSLWGTIDIVSLLLLLAMSFSFLVKPRQ